MDLNSDGVINHKDFSIAGKVLSQSKKHDMSKKPVILGEKPKEESKKVQDTFEVGDTIMVKYDGKHIKRIKIEKVKKTKEGSIFYLAHRIWYNEALIVKN